MVPTLFVNHGAPTLALAESEYTRFLTDLGKRIVPKAIVMFSAHWEKRTTTISFAEGTLETIYDFGGFPDKLYQMIYPATGSPELASRVEQMLQKMGIKTDRDPNRGLDHGSWIFLKYMYPKQIFRLLVYR